MIRNESLLVVGHIAKDTIFGAEHVGGSAFNIASTSSRLGIETRILSAVDNTDFGNRALGKLSSFNISTSLVQATLQQMPVCIVFDNKNDFGSSQWIDNGAYEAMSKLPIEKALLSQSSLVHMVSCPRNLTEAILAFESNLSYEPGPIVYRSVEELSLRVAAKARYTFFNLEEWEAVARVKGLQDPTAIMGHKSEAVIMTGGEKGSTIFTKNDKALNIKPIKPRKIIDYTGAGDQFKAGFLAGQFQGKSLEESAHIGALLASKTLEVVGGQLPSEVIDDVKREYFDKI